MTDLPKPPSANGRLKAIVAAGLRRAPFVVEFALRLWRLRLPKFTAGVVGVVVNDAGEVLLLEHVFHAESPWGLPGGWINRREDPEKALMRELVEEIGLPVTVERHLLTVAHTRYGHLDFAYLCHAQGEVTHLSVEIMDYAWFAPPELPPLAAFHGRAVRAAFPEQVQEGR